MSISTRQHILSNIDSASDKCTIVRLQPDKTPFFNFSLDTHSKLEMFSNGYKQIQNYWE